MRHMSEAEYSYVCIWLWWFAIGNFAAGDAAGQGAGPPGRGCWWQVTVPGGPHVGPMNFAIWALSVGCKQLDHWNKGVIYMKLHHFENFLCRQWCKFHENNISVSIYLLVIQIKIVMKWNNECLINSIIEKEINVMCWTLTIVTLLMKSLSIWYMSVEL